MNHRPPPSRLLICATLLLCSAAAQAGTLAGTVKGVAQDPKRFARVEINGPQTVTAFTNEQGKFGVQLAGGTYTVKVTERNRSQRFKAIVPAAGTVEQEFKVEW
jgi:hypothetical protein